MGYMAGTFTTGLEGYSVSQYTSSLHPFVQENTAEVAAALRDSPEEMHLAAPAQTIAPRYLQGGLGPASFHGSDDGSEKVYQYQTRSSGEFEGFSTYPTQMGGAQVTPHGQQLSGYHYEQQQQVAL
jgi:GH43 family beta-xylosidase